MPDTVNSRIRKLTEIAQELRQGKSFSITRLTRIKALCEDPHATAQFTIYMARLVWGKIKDAECPDHLEPGDWDEHKKLVSKTFSLMESYMESPTPESASAMRRLLPELEKVQGQRDGPYGVLIRIINNRYVLLTEDALRCLLYPEMSSHLGYELAKDYAERYNPSYGTGLIPESAPLLEDIISFWCGYHSGQTLEEWKRKSDAPKTQSRPKHELKSRRRRRQAFNPELSSFERSYPSVARWVKGYGWIEIGQPEYSSSLIRVLDEGGMIWESDESYENLDKAMQALEEALADWMKQYK